MAESVVPFRSRRHRAIAITLAAALVVAVALLAEAISLADMAFVSGWLLFTLFVVLALFNVRKKLPYPPLLKSATWLQFHIYLGFIAILVFAFHTALRIPSGVFETTLYCLFVGLAGSGIVGIYLSRSVPNSLADRGNEVIFERIPQFRRQLGEQARALVLRSIEEHDSFVLSDFYRDRLAHFMEGPQHYWFHLIRSSRPRNLLLHDLAELHRYLNAAEIEIADELAEIIGMKDDLDFHYVRQGLLKLWLFVHIPLTWVLMLFLAVHVVLVYAFSGTSL